MASTTTEGPDGGHCGADYWKTRWGKGQTGFHSSEVHPMLKKYFNKLFPDGTANKIFVPLCGKSVDMKWLSEQNISVVGLDVAPLAAEQFFTEQGMEYTQEALAVEGGGTLYKEVADKVHFYCCNMMKFDETLEGQFDAIWDRASLVAMKREDLPRYIKVMKSILKPGGRYLLETMDYDTSIMKDVDSPTCPPPPYPMYLEELKTLYEPEFSIEYLDRQERKLAGKDIHTLVFLMLKKS